MCTKRDVVIFLAGAQVMHTVSHISLAFSGLLPLTMFGITVTQQFNFWAIVINGLTALALLWWASRLPR